MGKVSARTKALITAVSLGLILFFVPALLAPSYTYNRWDSYQYTAPVIKELHSQLLHFKFPRINFHQHLGEPFQANTTGGLFYAPYTVAYALAQLVRLPSDFLIDEIILLHWPLGLLGLYFLLRKLSVRSSLAWSAAIAGMSGGYLISYSTVWIYVFMNFCWLSWGAVGLVEISEKKTRRRGSVLLALSLAATAGVGHSQLMFYSWLYLGLIWLVYGARQKRPLFTVIQALPGMLAGVLLSFPSIFPMLLFLPNSTRKANFSLAVLEEYSATKSSFLGMLTPLLKVTNGFLSDTASIFLYQGAQLLPFLLLASTAFLLRKKKIKSYDPSGHWILAILAVTVLFAFFSLGSNFFLFQWTYGIPIWSSMRWPNKFLLCVNWGLAILGGLSGERYLSSLKTHRRLAMSLSFLCLVLISLGLLFSPSPLLKTPSGILSLLSAIAVLGVLPWADRGQTPVIFSALILLSGISTIALSHQLGFRTYSDKMESFPASRFGINSTDRLLPLTLDTRDPPRINEFGLFHTATANGYTSLTGCSHDVLPDLYHRYLPSDIRGLFPMAFKQIFLKSNLLDTWNVRYVVVGKEDRESQKILVPKKFTLLKELENVRVFENRDWLPRQFFAKETHPFSNESLRDGLLLNGYSNKTALVEGEVAAGTYGDPPAILDSDWSPSGNIHVRLAPARPGFLVLSALYSELWQAKVDGKPVPVSRVNGILMGVKTPENAQNVELVYSAPGLKVALLLAALGGVLLVAICFGLWIPDRFIKV